MAQKKKFYGVAKGRVPGIYTNWADAKAQIEGFTGAVYKGFFTRKDAEAWMKNPKVRPNQLKGVLSENQGGPALPKAGEVTIYTDGGSLGNPGPGGYGVVEIYNNEVREFSGGFTLTTNNRMELTGAITALQNLTHRDKPVTLYTDSSYVVNGISKGWAQKWRKNKWLKSNKEPAINPDLWETLLELVEELSVTFMWVKGHAGNKYNERCDQLAVSAAKGNNLKVDSGYKGK